MSESYNHRIKYVIAPCFVMILFASFNTAAQISGTVTRLFNDDRLLSCDEQVERQDFVVANALEKLGNDSILIVILSQGDGELSEKLVAQRLYNINHYFEERGARLAPEKVMTAVGEPVNGLGRIEYYLRGQIRGTVYYP